jgi:hypothetical protein
MGTGARRKESGAENEPGRKAKGRLIQERDQQAMAWVGMMRVLREGSVADLVFSGRDRATFANRVSALARNLEPVGAYCNGPG